MAASSSDSRPRASRSRRPAKPSAAPSAASCGAIPHAEATTSPGKVAVPTEWVKNASRRSTIQAPSTPASTASSPISTSARCM